MQCERTTERELAKLRSHVQMRGLPSTLSAHAQDRTKTFADGLSGFRRLDALRWSWRLGAGLGSGSGSGLGFGSGFGFGLRLGFGLGLRLGLGRGVDGQAHQPDSRG